jgi:hypothetical protein
MINCSVRQVIGMLLGEANREAPVRTEPHPPMVSVKLPKSVLVVFHLVRATKLPFFAELKWKSGIDYFEPRLLLAPRLSGSCWTRAASYRRMSEF